MPSNIKIYKLDNAHIYNDGESLNLNRRGRRQLSEVLSKKLSGLVETTLFQQQFKDFLPPAGSQEESRVRIHIRDREIVVQKLNRDGDLVGASITVNLDDFEEDKDHDEVEGINQDILAKANRIYLKQRSDAHTHRSRTASPISLSGRAYTHHRGRDDDRRAYRREGCHSDTSGRGVRIESISPSSSPARINRRTSAPSAPLNHPNHRTTLNPRPFKVSTDAGLQAPVTNNPGAFTVTTTPGSQQRPAVRSGNPGITSTASTPVVPPITTSTATPNTPIITSIPPQPEAITTPHPQPVKSDWSISSEHFQTLIELSKILSDQGESEEYSKHMDDKFMTVPKDIRNEIFFEQFLFVDPSKYSNPWPIGERLFKGEEKAWNECRSDAIRQYLLFTLALDLGDVQSSNLPPEFLDRFEKFPEKDKDEFLTQLNHIQPRVNNLQDAWSASVTNKQRSKALLRTVQKRGAQYNHHQHRQYVEALIKEMEVRAKH
jgi:hypothetical protein